MGLIKDKEGIIEYVVGGIYPKRLLLEIDGLNEWEDKFIFYYNSAFKYGQIPCFIFLEDGCIVIFFYGQLKHGGYKEFSVHIVQYVDLGNIKIEDPDYKDPQLEVYTISGLECSIFLRLKLKFKVKREDQKKFVNDEQYFWYLSEKFREFIYNGEKY